MNFINWVIIVYLTLPNMTSSMNKVFGFILFMISHHCALSNPVDELSGIIEFSFSIYYFGSLIN